MPRTKIKIKIGRDGKGDFAIALSEVLGLVQPWELLPPPSPAQRTGVGSTTVSGGAANPVRWSTDTASALENAVISQLFRPLKGVLCFLFKGKKYP